MTVLAATDLSENSRSAVRAAATLAVRRGVPLEVLHCDEAFADDAAWRMFVETPWEDAAARKREMRKRLSEFIDRTLTDVPESLEIRRTVVLDHVDDAIREATDKHDLEMVVVGATGASGLAKAVLGSTAEDVVRISTAPVLVVPAESDVESIDEILAPVDLSEPSRMSLARAIALAREYGARLHVLRAIEVPTASVAPYEADSPPIDMPTYETQMREALEEFLAEFDTTDIEVSSSLPIDTPHAAIVRIAEDRGSDLVVMGTHGRRGLDRLLLGSTTSRVLRRIPTPVLTVRPVE